MAAPEKAVQDNVVSVKERGSPHFSPKGGKFKTLKVMPSVEQGFEYDDNIYRDADDSESDIVSLTRPAVDISTDWALHELKAGASAEVARYKKNSDENYEDYLLYISGIYDISYGMRATAQVKHDVRHEDRGSLEDANGDEPTKFAVDTAELGFARDLSVVKLYLRSVWRGYDYDDGDLSGVTIDNSNRDRIQSLYEAKLGYELSDKSMLYILGQYDRREYDNASQSARNSDGVGARIGLSSDITGKARVDVYGGYMKTSYESVYDGINAVDFGGKFLWNVTDISSVKASVERSVQETALVGSAGIVETVANVGVEHAFKENVVADLKAEVRDNQYEGDDALAESRDNVRYTNAAGVDYLLNDQWKVRTSYTHEYRDFSDENEDYSDNKLMLSLRFSY